MAKTKLYTYIDLASDIKALVNGEETIGTKEVILAKAEALRATNEKKAIYNANSPKKSKAKGPNEETLALMEKLTGILSEVPMTYFEINESLGTEYTAMRIDGAVSRLPGFGKEKVKRMRTNAKGLTKEDFYVGYTLNPLVDSEAETEIETAE